MEWDTEWDDSDDSDDDASSIYTSQSEYSDTDSEYPNSDSEYDSSSEQVSLNEFEEIEEGSNFDTDATKTQEEASVTIDVSSEPQVSAVPANIADEPEVSAPVDQANTANHNTLLAVDETEDDAAISDTANDLDNTALV